MILNKISIILIAALSIFAVYCSIIIGISWDEAYHNTNGLLRAEYLISLGKVKNYIYLNKSEYYPGLYDTLSSLLISFISKFSAEKYFAEIKHLVNLVFSFFSLIGLFLITKKLFNKEVAFLAIILCYLNPFFFGHISINPKDTIISFALIWFAYFTYTYCENFNKKRLPRLILTSLFMGFGLGVKTSFFVITIPIIVATLFYLYINFKSQGIKLYQKIFFDILIFFSISIFLMLLTWPHVFHDTFASFIDKIISPILWSTGPRLAILGGHFYETANTPRIYLFHFFLFRIPIYVLMLLTVLAIFSKIDKNFFYSNFLNYRNKLIVIVSVLLFPVVISIILKIKMYDGIRLFLFLMPIISLLSAISSYYIFRNIKKSHYIKVLATFITLFFFLFLSRFFYLTPYQYTYSNFFHIKFANAQNFYEQDYWGTSFKELIKLFSQKNDITNTDEIKIARCGGGQHGINYYLDLYVKNAKLVDVENADYIIMTNRASFDVKDKSTCYSKYSGKNILAVNRLGVNLSVIRKLQR